MAIANYFNRKLNHYDRKITFISKQVERYMDEYEQSGRHDESELVFFKKQLYKYEDDLCAIEQELAEVPSKEEYERGVKMLERNFDISRRIKQVLKGAQLTSPSMPTTGEPTITCKPTPDTLLTIHLPIFDGSFENWHHFYDTFSFIIDRDEQLTTIRKFHYLRSCLTGQAARSIQSLDVIASNYSIAIDMLKDKFDCHRQICMRHWELLVNYPKITTETPEAVDDLLDTVKLNLHALEKLGEPVTSNVVLIDLLTSKLPPDTICEWQCTLPNKQMPLYMHLMDFLKTRTNGDSISSTSTVVKRTSDQRNRQRQAAPRSQTLVCPTCQGRHNIWNCDVFKAKSVKRRFEIVKGASLCINCLRKGHSFTQCHAGSCRICKQRHHTYLHREQSSTDRSSSEQSSSDRSYNGRSPTSSPTLRPSHRSRRSDHTRSTPKRESRSSQSKVTK